MIKYKELADKVSFPLLLICFMVLLVNYVNISANYSNIINLLNVCVGSK